ncbi:BadF/BadG/BcrA/BcrD ATPase family protein [Microbacterium sp. BWT-B31]|uniref:N-acetylglucosamine kinase n=1 Tax=Microbacterium sp. BWT-B31 TaxID=3232072 RepID=UPI0035284941
MTTRLADRRRTASIDVGQTGVRLRASDGRTSSMPAPSHCANIDAMRGLLAELRGHWVREWGDWIPPDCVGAGLTGEFPTEQRLLIGEAISALLHCETVVMAHDSVAAYLGALGSGPGTVTMCGTGSVTLCWSGTDRPRRFDGLGELGDWGGGRSISRAGLRAAVRALDGVGPDTALTSAFSSRWDSPAHLADGLLARNEDAMRSADDFTRDVVVCAAAGDRIAASIIEQAAITAAQTTVAAVTYCNGRRVASLGGLFTASELFHSAWHDAVTRAVPDAVIVAPLGNALDGAQRMLSLTRQECESWDVTRYERTSRERAEQTSS